MTHYATGVGMCTLCNPGPDLKGDINWLQGDCFDFNGQKDKMTANVF